MTKAEYNELYKKHIKNGWEMSYAEELNCILLKKWNGKWGGHNVYKTYCKYPLTLTKEQLDELLSVDMA